MNYEKRYLSFADNLTENITESARQGKTVDGLGSRPKTETPKLEYNEDSGAKYMSLVRSIFREVPKKENIEAYLNTEKTNEESSSSEETRPKARPIRVEDMDEREMLAKTIEAEAGNQDFTGKLAVGEVISNRVQTGRWGDSLESVILARGQFSPWNSVTGYAGGKQGRDMNKLRPSEDAYKAADAILSGEYEPITNGALNYFAIIPGVSEKPAWANDSFIKLGDHYFGKAD